jgi:hypothetical protein
MLHLSNNLSVCQSVSAICQSVMRLTDHARLSAVRLRGSLGRKRGALSAVILDPRPPCCDPRRPHISLYYDFAHTIIIL